MDLHSMIGLFWHFGGQKIEEGIFKALQIRTMNELYKSVEKDFPEPIECNITGN